MAARSVCSNTVCSHVRSYRREAQAGGAGGGESVPTIGTVSDRAASLPALTPHYTGPSDDAVPMGEGVDRCVRT